jgi:hypothetical protein
MWSLSMAHLLATFRLVRQFRVHLRQYGYDQISDGLRIRPRQFDFVPGLPRNPLCQPQRLLVIYGESWRSFLAETTEDEIRSVAAELLRLRSQDRQELTDWLRSIRSVPQSRFKPSINNVGHRLVADAQSEQAISRHPWRRNGHPPREQVQ